MARAKDVPPVTLALSQKDAASALGICVNTFKEHVRPELKAVYIAGATRYPVSEIQRWLDKEAKGSEYRRR